MLSIIGRLQPHPVVVDHAIGRDRAFIFRDQKQGCLNAVQILQLFDIGTAAVGVHIVVTANGFQVGEVGDDSGLLATEGKVDQVFQLEQFHLACHGLELRGLAIIKLSSRLAR